MTNSSPESIFFEIQARIRELNQLAKHLEGIGELFPDTSVPPPSRLVPAELGMIRSVSWAYVILFEVARVDVRYLADLAKSTAQQASPRVQDTLDLVNKLRTFFQHHLDSTSERSADIESKCATWFNESCGTSVPATEEHWQDCLAAFLTLFRTLLDDLVSLVRHIEAHGNRKDLLKSWESRKRRYLHPSEFDTVVEQVCNDIGRGGLDPVKFRQRHFDRWIKQLEVLGEGADLASEIRRLVESSLLSEVAPVLPISGNDIINHFQLQPGPLVGQLLQEAKSIYGAVPCDRATLLSKLQQVASDKKLLQ